MSERKKNTHRPPPLDSDSNDLDEVEESSEAENDNNEATQNSGIRGLFTAWVLFKTNTPNMESVKKQLRRYDLHVVEADDGELLVPVEGCEAASLRPDPRLSKDQLDVFFAASVF